MINIYIEAILVWSDKGPSVAVKDWFIKQKLMVTSMRNGLLISGEQSVFENLFQLKPLPSEKPFELPKPDELGEYVTSITIPKPRKF